jgi:hypothetical protein
MDKWLVFRQNRVYLTLPKASIDLDIENLELLQKKVGEQALEAMALSTTFLSAIQR